MTACFYCSQPVQASQRSVWRQVTGWEHKAERESRRGGSDIVLRERTGEVACDDCVRRLKLGLSPVQGSLL